MITGILGFTRNVMFYIGIGGKITFALSLFSVFFSLFLLGIVQEDDYENEVEDFGELRPRRRSRKCGKQRKY